MRDADRKALLLCLSHLPKSCGAALYDTIGGEPIIGRYAGLTLSDGEDIVNVETKEGLAGIRVDDLVMMSFMPPQR